MPCLAKPCHMAGKLGWQQGLLTMLTMLTTKQGSVKQKPYYWILLKKEGKRFLKYKNFELVKFNEC